MSFDFGALGTTYVDIVAKHGDLDTYLNSLPQIAGNAAQKAAGRVHFLTEEFQRQKVLLEGMVGAFGGMGQAMNNQFVRAAAQSLNHLGEELANATQQMNHLGRSSGRSGGGAAMGLLQLGYAIDDLQYGLRAIVNNIPQIALAFGASDKVAGGLAIGAVALNQFVVHWKEWADLLKDTPLKPVIDEVDKLAEAWSHAGDAAALHAKAQKDAATKAKSDAEAVSGIKAEGTTERGAGAQTAIEKFGGGPRSVSGSSTTPRAE